MISFLRAFDVCMCSAESEVVDVRFTAQFTVQFSGEGFILRVCSGCLLFNLFL